MAHAGALLTESRPLLAFGTPRPGRIPKGEKSSFKPGLQMPSGKRQGARLTPQFSTLLQTLNAGRASLGGTTAESDPQLVVVFDLAGPVANFMRAISGIQGLEFLAEFEEDPVEADEVFFYKDIAGEVSDDLVPETLYMVMSNARAAEELISLFGKWKRNKKVKFAKGLAPLKQAFAQLREVRRWGTEDRIRETRLLEHWRDDVAAASGQGFARVEIELWFRKDPTLRTKNQSDIESLVASSGGNIISSAVITEIEYHAILAEIPYNQVELVLKQGAQAIELLATESIMFVSSARSMTIPSPLTSTPVEGGETFDPPNQRPPRVALIDGVPMANHLALAGRLVLDDPDNLASQYTSTQQLHGTAMASLIIHGDLGNRRQPLSTQLYVRPIMAPHELFDEEVVAKNQLLVDVIHRAFHRIFAGDGNRPAAAPSIRIVNLSIGDPSRIFAHRLSPLAKLLDYLAHSYNLVILVSAGNHNSGPSIDASALKDQESLHTAILKSNFESVRLRRLFSPAEAMNVLTVGATHSDAADISLPDSVVDAIQSGMPAAYSAVGFGYRSSVKPEILLPGGRQIYQRPPTGTSGEITLTPTRSIAVGPGLQVAAPNVTGEINSIAYSAGTSNATALATRAISFIFDVLEGATSESEDFPFPDPQYHPVLAKTLLVHAANWGNTHEILKAALTLDPSKRQRELTRMLGYGPVDPTRVATASRTRAVLLGADSIRTDQRHTFTFPLPDSLNAKADWRRLTITLGWLSPINSMSQKHRMARLRFRPPQEPLGVERTEADWRAVRKGTVQHEVFEGRAAVAFQQDGVLTIDVDCRVDAGKLNGVIRYGLAVSLEMETSINADIHAEVRQHLQAQLRNRVAERTRT